MKSKKTNYYLSLAFGLIVLAGLVIAEIRSTSFEKEPTLKSSTFSKSSKSSNSESPAPTPPTPTPGKILYDRVAPPGDRPSGYHKTLEHGEFVQEDGPEIGADVSAEDDSSSAIIAGENNDDRRNIEGALPADLQRQLENPPQALPADLQAQLNAPPPPIPEDIQRALAAGTRVVSEEEVNSPLPETPSAVGSGALPAQ